MYLFYFGLVPDLQVDTLWVLCREGLYSKLCTFLFYTFLLLGNPFRNNCNLDKCQWNIFHYLSRSRASNVVPIVSENLTNKDPEVQNLSRYSFMNVIFFFWLPQFCLISSSLEFYWTFLILCKISNLLAIKIDWWKPWIQSTKKHSKNLLWNNWAKNYLINQSSKFHKEKTICSSHQLMRKKYFIMIFSSLFHTSLHLEGANLSHLDLDTFSYNNFSSFPST